MHDLSFFTLRCNSWHTTVSRILLIICRMKVDNKKTAWMFVEPLKSCTIILFQWLTPEGFRSLVALVGTNGQGIGTSPLSRWVRNCDNLEIPDEERKKLNDLIDDVYEQLEKGKKSFS